MTHSEPDTNFTEQTVGERDKGDTNDRGRRAAIKAIAALGLGGLTQGTGLAQTSSLGPVSAPAPLTLRVGGLNPMEINDLNREISSLLILEDVVDSAKKRLVDVNTPEYRVRIDPSDLQALLRKKGVIVRVSGGGGCSSAC